MRILILTQWFDPEPHYKGMVFAKALAARGHHVEVLTGFPNYPGGKLYPGYRIRPYQKEIIDGISVLRVPLYPSHDKSAIRRIVNYFSFALAAVPAIFTRTKYDAVYVYTPPPTAALAAWLYRKIAGVPYLCDVQDLWPDTLAATGMLRSRNLLRLVGLAVDRLFRDAGGIAVLSQGFQARLIKRGHDPRKIVVIPNWSPDTAIPEGAQPLTELSFTPDRFRIVFAGNIGTAQGLDVIIDAATQLRDAHPHIEFVVVGDGIDAVRLQGRVADLGLANVVFVGRRPPWAMDSIFTHADALLVHLTPDPLFEITIPSKTQAYMRAGRPILVGVAGDAAEMVEKASAGIAFRPGNADDLVRAIMIMHSLDPMARRAMGDNGRRYYRANLAIDHGVSLFEAALLAVRDRRPLS